jgi:hypothetical protein
VQAFGEKLLNKQLFLGGNKLCMIKEMLLRSILKYSGGGRLSNRKSLQDLK